MRARIYQPARTAMQSGQARTRAWVLEFEAADARQIDPLMGWTSSDDTQTQIRLSFDSREAAEVYAREHRLDYAVSEPHKRAPNARLMGYGDNFASGRRSNWTH
ncbi:ETC complex I subunit [Paenirhodobacter enshiensis]|uniref:ETC complex I subunit n=1 Tax=Paenirhodobacter enshiensis TaxID=1105367 RepID=A0A086XZN7_9RHOB|nr:ETC complex I subunit [Paenirhodobacter enshiensis]KFI27487.1 ETC complex I subunit [Paenirhodobacter enshiensis]